MAQERLDAIGGGVTTRHTATAAPKRLRLSTNAASRRRFDLRIVTAGGAIRYMLGGSDVVVSADTTNDTLNGKLGRYVSAGERWPIDMSGPDHQYMSYMRADGETADVVFELSQTNETHDDDLVTEM